MPDVFGDYGRYYDLLYADKDYRAEAQYVASLLERFRDTPCSQLPSSTSSVHAPSSKILEFGCGTGKHARLLAEMGYDVTGIERSAEMAAEAKSREQGAGSGEAGGFSIDDLRFAIGGAENGEPERTSAEAAELHPGRTGLPTRLDGSGEPSYDMTSEPGAKSGERRAEGAGTFRCVVADIRNTELGQTFDAVISLFHVVSYQTSDEDVTATFQNAGRHLRPDGLFLFDVWYGPAVLTQRPAVRVKRVQDEQVHLTRIAEPTLLPEQNCVHVDYTLFAHRLSDGRIERCAESHLMRYFTTPEIRAFADRHGFDVAIVEEWLTGTEPSTDTWGVCYVLRKRGAGSID